MPNKKNNGDILWIFLHIPKTAGSTFRVHIDHNFAKNEMLSLSWKRLGTSKNYPEVHKQQICAYLRSLPNVQKKRIKVIFGHFVPYGVHAFFDKEPRYITFVRDPYDRIISYYNHLVTLYNNDFFKREKLPHEVEEVEFIKEQLFYERGLRTFKQWLEDKYDQGEGLLTSKAMVRFLKELGYVDKSNNNGFFDKFYFVGIMENFLEDSLYLYSELGIKKFYRNQNVSKKYFVPTQNFYEKNEKLITSKIATDKALYYNAVELNRKFKKVTENFDKIVGAIKIKRGLSLPLTESLELIYSISARARYYFTPYSKYIDFLKKNLHI